MSPSKRKSRNKRVEEDDSDVGEQSVNVQSADQKREVRGKLREIVSTLRDLSGSEDQESEKLKSVIEEAKNIISEVQGTTEAIEDAKMFSALCKAVREVSEGTSTNERKFLLSDYCSALARAVNAPPAGDGFKFSKPSLVSLGNKTAAYFTRAPTVKFVLGTLNTEIGVLEKSVAEKRRVVNRPRDKVAAATGTAIVGKAQATEAKTDKFVKQTQKILEELYIKNRKEPVCYFTFVIDPDSFGKTVENMFHVSFLVKQRTAVLEIGKNGLPTLEPLMGRRGEEEEENERGSDQAVISICQADWVELKTNLKIKKKSIILS